MSYAIPFLFVLSVIIFVHELGHYVIGRWCGIGVEVFSVGFGPVIWSRRDRREPFGRSPPFPWAVLSASLKTLKQAGSANSQRCPYTLASPGNSREWLVATASTMRRFFDVH